MRPLTAVAFTCVASLAGCASTASDVMNRGQRQDFTVPLASRALAKCIAENARGFGGSYTASVDEMIRPGDFQVVVTRVDPSSLMEPRYPIIVARTSTSTPPAPVGSQLALFMSGRLGPAESADWIGRLRKNC